MTVTHKTQATSRTSGGTEDKGVTMKWLTLLIPAFLLIVCLSVMRANTIHVPSQQPTIQAGIDAAVSSDGDTVLVADGIYTGDGNRDIDFLGKAIVVMSENGAESCVIDCEEAGRGFYFHNEEESSSVLQGFSITNGRGDGAGIYCYNASPNIMGNTITGNTAAMWYGGGIYCVYSSPTITDNTITGNTGDEDGGGIYCSSSSPTIKGNTIMWNTADDGGGIYCCNSSSPTITDNTITGNTVYYTGGGIYCTSSSPTITGNTITGNVTIYYYGGGIYCGGEVSYPTIANNTISGNTASIYGSPAQSNGGGICCFGNSSPTITGNTITENTATGWGGGGIYCYSNFSPTITNSILWGNWPDQIYRYNHPIISYSNIQGGWPGEGNIDEDPMFVQPDTLMYTDYRLFWESPCIDTGDPNLFDPDRTRSDMGAHYFNQLDYLTLYITPDTTEVPPGGQLGITYTAINRWNWSQPFWALSAVKLSGSTPDIIMGPDRYKLPANYTTQVQTVYNIPPDARMGMYDYWAGIGLPPGIVFGQDSFKFKVTE